MKFCVSLFVFAAVSVVSAKHLGSGISHTGCPKLCEKIWDPVCAKLNGIQVSISNMCRLKELIKCASSKNRTIVFLHEGHCRKDGAMIEGEDTESEEDENVEMEGEIEDKESDLYVENELMKFFDDDSLEVYDDEEDYDIIEDDTTDSPTITTTDLITNKTLAKS